MFIVTNVVYNIGDGAGWPFFHNNSNPRFATYKPVQMSEASGFH